MEIKNLLAERNTYKLLFCCEEQYEEESIF